jgi:hypothetical protein
MLLAASRHVQEKVSININRPQRHRTRLSMMAPSYAQACTLIAISSLSFLNCSSANRLPCECARLLPSWGAQTFKQ